MSPNPKPITDYLSDFDAPAGPAPTHPSPNHATSPRPAPARIAPRAVPEQVNVPSAAGHAPNTGDTDLAARAFAAGKEEGLKLAEARAALERRRGDIEADRRAGERIAEAETRIGTLLAERLESEVGALKVRVEADLVRCLVPIAGTLAERRALDALASEAAGVAGSARWTVTGPDRLVDAFIERLALALRGKVDRRPGEGVDLTVEIDATVLRTRLASLGDALGAL